MIHLEVTIQFSGQEKILEWWKSHRWQEKWPVGDGRRRNGFWWCGFYGWDTQDMMEEGVWESGSSSAVVGLCTVLLTDHTKMHRHSLLQTSDSRNNIKIYLWVFHFPHSKSSQSHYLSSFIPVSRSHTQPNYPTVRACKWCFGIMGFLFRSFVWILRPLIFIRYYTPLITVRS